MFLWKPQKAGRQLPNHEHATAVVFVSRVEQDAAASNIRWKRAADGSWTLWFQSMQNGFQVIRFTGGASPLRPANAT